MIRPRDYTEDTEEGEEVSATGDSESKNVDKKRDLHLPHSTNIEGNKSKKRKVNLLTEEQRTESESGEDEERLSGGGEKASKESDAGDESLLLLFSFVTPLLLVMLCFSNVSHTCMFSRESALCLSITFLHSSYTYDEFD